MKRRIVGAAVLAALAVIFLPGLLEDPKDYIGAIAIQPAPPSTVVAKVFPHRKTLTTTRSTSPQPIAQKPTPAEPKLLAWVVQVGNYSNQRTAKRLQRTLRKSGFSAFLERIQVNGKTMQRLQIGPVLEMAEGKRIIVKIKKRLRLTGKVVRYPENY